jgi:hypothetical protein
VERTYGQFVFKRTCGCLPRQARDKQQEQYM